MRFRKGDAKILDDVLDCLETVDACMEYQVTDQTRFDEMMARIEEMRDKATQEAGQ